MARRETHVIIRDRDGHPRWTACGSKELLDHNRPGTTPTCTLCLAYQKRTGNGPESLKSMFRV